MSCRREVLLVFVLLVACERAMYNGARLKPYEPAPRSAGLPATLQLPAGSVPTNAPDLQPGPQAATTATNDSPVPVDIGLLQKGQRSFSDFCVPCHGLAGDGEGIVVQRGYPQPPSFHEERLRKAPVGYFYAVITQGINRMQPYAQLVTPKERWAIAAYIKALQLSQNASVGELSEADRRALRAAGGAP